MKGLHDAAVDKDPGRIGGRGLSGRHQIICAIVNEPQGYRVMSDQLKSMGLERLGCPYGHLVLT